ncbi:MAG: threonylcarbamoyl-AMP synthase [Candidatus Marinimicrobia bacterium]|nr:threonylcarbamoyl-AMP synthase [Candidatus Neomarinimicrobiota bacterium]
MEIKIDTAMKYINISDVSAIDIASEVIQDGGLIAYPTDTLYGLGCDARNAQAIKKINLIKNRKTPISVIVWSLEVAASWTLASKKEFDEASTFIKESSTVILPVKNHIVHPSILADDGTLGLRMPHCDFPIALCAKLGFPITTTSINRTGQPPLSDPKLIKEQFDSEIDLIIDAGIIPNGKASTIYKLTNSKFSIIRS